MDHQDVEPQRTIDAADPPDSRLLEVSDPLGQGPLSAPDPTRRGERRPDSGGGLHAYRGGHEGIPCFR